MQIDVSGYLFSMPYKCACCCGTPDTELSICATKSRGKRVKHIQTRTWSFPYCRYCIDHIQAAENVRRSGRVLALLSIFAGILVGSYTQVALGVVAALIALVVTVIIGHKRLEGARAQCKRTCASFHQAVSYLGWYGMLHRFEMGSADFARDFITLNKKKIVNLSPTTRALLSSAIPNYAASSSPPQAGLEVQTAAFPVVQQGGTDQPTMRTPMVVIALVVLVGLAALFYWQMQQRVIRKSAVIIDNRPGNSTRTQYSTYYNERFGFTLEYPASFIPREVPTNGDGLTFSSPSGDAELTTAAGNNSGSTVGDLYKMSLQNVTGQVRYNRIGANWFVISWDDGERIGYTRMFAGNGSQNSFTFMYPKQRAHEYNKTVIHLEASFRPGDLSRGW